MDAAYVIIENHDGTPRAIHHPSWGAKWVTLRPNGELDIHERKVERAPAPPIRLVRA